MAQSRNNLLDLFSKILAVLGFIIALIDIINGFLKLTTDTQGLRVVSVAGFITYLLAILWLVFKATGIKPVWRWSSLVILYIITILYSIWVGNTWINHPQSIACTDYGIKVTSPVQGAAMGGEFDVSGSYTARPPENSIVLIYASPTGQEYWPQSIAQIDPTYKTWSGKFLIAGSPPQQAAIIVAIMGTSGRALFDYYMKVGRETGNTPAITRLTDDVVECARISVVRTK
jgi:hypothetical protein